MMCYEQLIMQEVNSSLQLATVDQDKIACWKNYQENATCNKMTRIPDWELLCQAAVNTVYPAIEAKPLDAG